MPSGGSRWNSNLPKGGNTASGPRDSGDHPGRNGGQENRNGEIRGKHKMSEPELNFGGTAEEIAQGAKMIRDILTSERMRPRIERAVDKSVELAEGGNLGHARLILGYIAGTPVAMQHSESVVMTGDQVADMAEQVRENFKKDGLAIVKSEKTDEAV